MIEINFHNKRFYPVVLILAIGLFFSCRNKIEEIKAITDVQNYPVQITSNAEYLFTENGVLKNKLVASKMERYEGKDTSRTIVSGGFLLYVFDSFGKITATMSAKNGIYYPKQNILIAMDSVKLVNEKNQMLETSKLTWLQDSDRVMTQDTVKITSSQGIIYGKGGLVSNSSFTNYRLIDPVGDIYIKEENTNGESK